MINDRNQTFRLIQKRLQEKNPEQLNQAEPAEEPQGKRKKFKETPWKQRLYDPANGMPKLLDVRLPTLHQEPGHEASDMEALSRIYREFFHQVFPKQPIVDVLSQLRTCREGSFQLYILEGQRKAEGEVRAMEEEENALVPTEKHDETTSLNPEEHVAKEMDQPPKDMVFACYDDYESMSDNE
eukprot:PhF_6_TR30288/c0_g1_i1/m.44438